MTETKAHSDLGWRIPALIILAGCLISLLGFGPRSALGLFLTPMTEARGWGREPFAFALAVQNLLWGATVPIASALSDRFGPRRVIALGAICYTLGLVSMAHVESPLLLVLTAGVLTGTGIGFASFSIAIAVLAKVMDPSHRSLALGLGTAAGSLGQVLFSPYGLFLIGGFGWQAGLYGFAAMTLLIVALVYVFPATDPTPADEKTQQSLSEALSEALHHRGFILLTFGFFVCGFHVAFITVHMPAYVRDLGLPASIGAIALSLIGLFNIIGSVAAGAIGQKYSKRISLSGIYFLRTVAIVLLLVLPKNELTILLFSAAMGLLWLATVPLTSGIVMQVFGVRYLATLFGVVFFSHQVGSFSGVWLGGWLYDRFGSYDAMWYAAIFFGLAATLVHLPIDERPLKRLHAAPVAPA